MRAGAKWIRITQIMVACGLILSGCRPDAPAASPETPQETATPVPAPAPAAAAVVAPVPTTATADDAAFAATWDRFGGLTRAAQGWEAGAVDGLCVIRGPGLDLAALDDHLRDYTTALQSKPTVDRVLTRALDSEGRLLVRFKVDVTAAVAQAELAAVAQTAATPGGSALAAVTECTLIARGQRARAIWQIVAPGGPAEATTVARALQTKLLASIPCLTHAEVVGGVEQATTLEIQTKTVADNRIGFDQVLSALQSLAQSPPDEWAQVLADQSVTRRVKTTDGSPQEVPLSRLVARSGGLVATPRTARNGQVAVTAVVAYGGHSCRPAELGRRLPQLLVEAQAATKARIQPVMTEGNVRLRLGLPRGTAYEGEASLSKKLQEIRLQPTVIGLYSQSSVDGIPVGWDLDARGGRTWTVWLTDGEGEGMTVAMNAAHLLSSAGWQVQPEPVGSDTGVTWLLGQTAPAGVVLAGATAERVRAALGQATALLNNVGGRQALQSGPTRLPGDHVAAAWRLGANTSSAPPALLVALDDLHRGPLTLATSVPAQGPTEAKTGVTAALPLTLRVVLPQGERAAAAAAMPLTYTKSRDPAAQPTAVLLGTLREQVLPSPVMERLRWNGRPTVWLSSLAFDRAPSAPEMELHQALVTLQIAEPEVQAWPWCERPEVGNNPAPAPPAPGAMTPPKAPGGSPVAPLPGPPRGRAP